MKAILSMIAMIFGFSSPQISQAEEKNMIVIDVRTPDEFNSSHVEGSINIDFLNPNFMKEIAKLDKNQNYKVYCRSGNRSGQAEKMMKTLGFLKVENIGSVQQASAKLNRKCVEC